MSTNGDRDYPNNGILFRETEPKGNAPRDYKGTADIECPHCGARFQTWLSAWIKAGRKGKFMSLSFKAKDTEGRRGSMPGPDQDENIPF